MYYHRSIVYLVSIICLILNVCLAQTITQEDFLNQLKQKHPLFEKENLTAQIEAEAKNSYLGMQDWILNSSLAYSHEEPSVAFAGPERTDAVAFNVGVDRLFWETGGRLSASFSTSGANIKIDPMFGFPDTFYENKIALTYLHPLMKNKNGFLDRLQYDLKQFDIDFSEIQALENQEEFLKISASKFLDWAFLSEQKNIIAERLKLTEGELERTKRKRRANLVDKVDVIRAEDAVQIARQNQVLIESRWNALQAELAVLSQNEEIKNVEPEFNLYQISNQIPLEKAIEQLKENSRLLKTLNVRVKQLEFVNKGNEAFLEPDLSAFAQLNTKNLDASFGKSLQMDKPDAIVGLQFSVPLGNRTVKSNISKTKIQIDQLKKQTDDVTLALTSSLTNLVIQIRELENVLKLNLEQIESAKERTKEELKRYNQGRGDLTFVILSQDNEQNAKLTHAGNALTYQKLLIEYKALMDEYIVE